MKKIIPIVIYICVYTTVSAQNKTDTAWQKNWNYHFQVTSVIQNYLPFTASYTGANSLPTRPGTEAVSLTTTLYVGRKLWKGAAFYFDPEIAGGRGINGAVGIAGFTNGETFRIGNPTPELYVARGYLHQDIALPHSTYEIVADNNNQISEKVPTSRISISAGKFAIADFYDDNKYSHDPRVQFLNWALMSNGAWDYPANTRGYTSGLVVELIKPTWAVRGSVVAEPLEANGPVMDHDILKSHGSTVEVQKSFKIHKQQGIVRLLAFDNKSQALSYAATIKQAQMGDSSELPVFTGKKQSGIYGGDKHGLGLSANQDITGSIGLFARAGWNDGKTGTWAFTEIDQSASLGLVFDGNLWKRINDKIGVAGVVNGISKDHRAFLNDGFTGFMIGDGKLTNYGHEGIIEVYYLTKLFTNLYVTADYQFVNNPAYNKDRGPVSVYALRVHIEF